ncbi:hypothetical protein DUI87_08777 [Hirundo rustica rustica]|uniref:PH domain-containing protein n=1 Tax=Hirundo rustica rustica TaxID=333673 RepID=A0A3M0KKC0_HIRRU|nr:hypothetical protein DUI87_08777 [Hirundo rustica rustica]
MCLCVLVVTLGSGELPMLSMEEHNGSSETPALSQGRHVAIKCGWLRKQGGFVKTWHTRWFVLKGDQLYYFKDEDETKPLVRFSHFCILKGEKYTEVQVAKIVSQMDLTEADE